MLHGPVIITKGYWAQQQTAILNWWIKLFLPLNKIILMRSLWRSITQGYCCNNNKTREQERKVGYNLILGNVPPFPHWRFAYVGTLFLWLWLQRYSAIALFLVPFRTLNRFSISSTMDFEWLLPLCWCWLLYRFILVKATWLEVSVQNGQALNIALNRCKNSEDANKWDN